MQRRIRRSSLLAPLAPTVLALVATGCGSKPAETVSPDVAPQAAPAAQSKVVPPNTGGMWLPMQMPAHAQALKERGYQGDPGQLSDPSKFPLSAVVSLGGCSGSFVSGDGLVVTNHHCVTGILQFNSTPEQNLLRDGYVAKDRGQERWAGPTQRIFVTTGFRNVTQDVLAAGSSANNPEARAKALSDKQKELTNTCEAGRPEVRCPVVPFFEGEQYFQIEQLEVRDVRLVYAPAEGTGNFGGEIDNWRWPRHTGDFSFLRAYVGPDGKPADHSPQNVPFKSTSHLKVAQGDLDEGDFVMVAGYPGRTSRLKTADEVYDAMSVALPERQQMMEEWLVVLEKLKAEDPQLAIKVHARIRGLNNGLTKTKGMIEGLSKDGLARKKADEEAKLRAWMAADETRFAAYHDVFDQLAAIQADIRSTRETDAAHDEIVSASALLGAVNAAMEAARERETAGKAGLNEGQQRAHKRRVDQLEASFKNYDPRIEKALLELALARTARLPQEKRPALYQQVVGSEVSDAATISTSVDKLVKKTKMGDLAALRKLLDIATVKQLERSPDPVVKLAVWIDKNKADRTARTNRQNGALSQVRPRYISLLRAYKGDNLAPDANSTLRLTYGSVRGYSPAPGRAVYRPFTVVSEMVAKHSGQFPFIAPARLLAVAKAKTFGNYVDPELKEVPVDFLADLDITGGNSGSATLNAKGELVGLAFDGNYEAMASDWMFLSEIQRSIHVDIRYGLWMMDAVDGADHLLEEMGVASSVNGPNPAPEANVAPAVAQSPAAAPATAAAPAAAPAPAAAVAPAGEGAKPVEAASGQKVAPSPVQ